MEWTEVDLEQGFWTIPRRRRKSAMKRKVIHIVPLSTQAQALLQTFIRLPAPVGMFSESKKL